MHGAATNHRLEASGYNMTHVGLDFRNPSYNILMMRFMLLPASL